MSYRDQPPQNCTICGKEYRRRPNEAKLRFEQRRYCGPRCGNLGRNRDKPVKPKVVATEAEAYDDLSHGDKTSIADESARIALNEHKRSQTVEERARAAISLVYDADTRDGEKAADQPATDPKPDPASLRDT